MAKRDNVTTRANGTTTADQMEQRVVAFAEQLGRIAGTFHAKAEGWLDREALTKQIARVRDSATALLEQLGAGPTNAPKRAPAATPVRGRTKGRSGGAVDAPGKKHRKPLPADPGANLADSQAAKMRMARPMIKTTRRRGRG
jgi:hypothetical protein